MVLINMSTPNINLQIPRPVAVFLNTNTSKNKLVNVPDKSPAIAPNKLVNVPDKSPAIAPSLVVRFQNKAAQ